MKETRMQQAGEGISAPHAPFHRRTRSKRPWSHRAGSLLVALLLTVAAVEAASTDDPNRKPLPASTRLFQVTLVEATIKGEAVSEGIPKVALDSLSGMRDFLPYKGYRLLDSGLIRMHIRSNAHTTLKGPKGKALEVGLRVDWDAGADGASGEGFDLSFREFHIIEMNEPEVPGVTKGSSTGGTPAPAARRTLISTSFGMDIGETLVVGSSRLDGDQSALIVLVTALP